MDIIEWGATPWGQPVPLHIAWHLLWLSLWLGLAFLAAHALWMGLRHKPEATATAVPPEVAACVPARVPRHSLPARLYHWLMAACMLTLLVTAFLPKAGFLFPWVNVHYTVGMLLILALLFHLIHAIFFMDFWSIWPTRAEIAGLAGGGPAPGKPGKYPLGNKLYHLALVAVGLTVAATGCLMLSRVRTPFFTRNPYLLGDATWGGIYLLHGLAGVSLIALAIVHVYFAARPEKRPVTTAMITGSMDRDYVLAHHDPRQWGCSAPETK